MGEIVNLISSYGVMIVIVALFLWDWISNKKDTKNSIVEMKNTNINTSKSLDLLQKSMENQEKIIQEHDRRSLDILEQLKEINRRN